VHWGAHDTYRYCHFFVELTFHSIEGWFLLIFFPFFHFFRLSFSFLSADISFVLFVCRLEHFFNLPPGGFFVFVWSIHFLSWMRISTFMPALYLSLAITWWVK